MNKYILLFVILSMFFAISANAYFDNVKFGISAMGTKKFMIDPFYDFDDQTLEPPANVAALLLQNSAYLLLEDDSKLLLE